MAKVLFLSQKTIGENMAGPGIRLWELAKCLAKENKVCIVAPEGSSLTYPNIEIYKYSLGKVVNLILKSEIIIVQIFFLKFYWLLLGWLLRKKIIIDAYFPFYLENLETYSKSPREGNLIGKIDSCRIKFLLKIGDFFMCSSQRQRDLWIGWLSALGRLNLSLYCLDKSFRKIVETVPIGVREEKPIKSRNVLKGVMGGIKANDIVVLWLSGIWPWFDPLSAIRAINLIKDDRVKLVFLGLEMVDDFFKGEKNPLLHQAIELSERLGLHNRKVFFISKHIPYQEIPNYLLEADIAINTHHNHLETQYAFRGRVLEYIWANLPIITTRGDVLAEEVSRRGLGIVVDYENEEEIAQAILKLVNDRNFYNQCKENLREFANILQWEKVSQPLMTYCACPTSTPDNKGITDFISLTFLMLRFYFLSFYFLLRYKGIKSFWAVAKEHA